MCNGDFSYCIIQNSLDTFDKIRVGGVSWPWEFVNTFFMYDIQPYHLWEHFFQIIVGGSRYFPEMIFTNSEWPVLRIVFQNHTHKLIFDRGILSVQLRFLALRQLHTYSCYCLKTERMTLPGENVSNTSILCLLFHFYASYLVEYWSV